MREIKFRAWDKKRKIMMYQKDMDYLVLPGKKIPSEWENVELMQYTGLKDKNGKEIYEGDIIESSDKSTRYEMVFEDGGFIAKSLDIKDFYSDVSNYHKIIGNIYENKDLI